MYDHFCSKNRAAHVNFSSKLCAANCRCLSGTALILTMGRRAQNFCSPVLHVCIKESWWCAAAESARIKMSRRHSQVAGNSNRGPTVKFQGASREKKEATAGSRKSWAAKSTRRRGVGVSIPDAPCRGMKLYMLRASVYICVWVYIYLVYRHIHTWINTPLPLTAANRYLTMGTCCKR